MNKDDEKRLRELCMEMTGHSDDPFVAFEQWVNERDAISGFYADAQAYRNENHRLDVNWKIIRHILFGRIKEGQPLKIQKISASAMERLEKAVRKLDGWDDAVKRMDSEHVDVTENSKSVLRQLKLL